MSAEASIVVRGVHKRYGPTVALDGMTLTVLPGLVTGFVGPNGAGKSTTMRVIVGLDAPDAGTALIGGRPYRSLRHPMSHLGALLDAAAVQPGRSGRNHLLWLARSQGLPARRADEVAESELLANAAKHAPASRVMVDIRRDGQHLRIGVTDDGPGGADPARGSGLGGIERRLAAFDGILVVTSPRGGPTSVSMEILCALSSPKTSSC